LALDCPRSAEFGGVRYPACSPPVPSGLMVTDSKGPAGSVDEPETAQQTYDRMLRDWMAPALRQMGFKDSGHRFRFPHHTYEARLHFQKSRWSTREIVSFSVRFDVLHRPTFEVFCAAARDARTNGGHRPAHPTAGNYSQTLEDLTSQRDQGRNDIATFEELNDAPHWWETSEVETISPRSGWWELPAGGPIEPLAQVVIEAIRELALPAIQRELERPLDPRFTPDSRHQVAP
jgi:hypothetical protein